MSNQVKMGDRSIASAQAGVHNDVAPGEIVSGAPAIPYKRYLKVSAILNRLPDMYQTLKQLQRKFND